MRRQTIESSRLLNEMYVSFENNIACRQYKKAMCIFMESLRYSLLYIIKTIFNKRYTYWRYFLEVLFRLRYRFPLFKTGVDFDSKIIVSMTSYPARFGTLHICLKSLLQQDLKPCSVVLYLDKWVAYKDIPRKVRRLEKYGLKIKIQCDDLKPHNKYYYAFQEYPECIVITVDDDQIYPPNLISSLYKSYSKFPKVISARRVMRILYGKEGHLLPSNMWEGECKTEMRPSMELLAQGVGGVLYPPSIFGDSKYCFDKGIIRDACWYADDIWLKFIEKSMDIPVVWVPNKLIFHAIHYETRLMNNNVFCNDNDSQIKNCEKFLGIRI